MKQRKAILSITIPNSAYSTSEAEKRAQGRERYALPFTVLTDNREKKPFSVPAKTKRCHLTTGDYSIAKLDHIFSIERKSAADLASTTDTVRRRARFGRELERMAAMQKAGGYACIIVEASRAQMLRNPPAKPAKKVREYDPGLAWKHLLNMSMKWNIPVWAMESRAEAEAWAEVVLRCAYSRLWREIC